MEEIKLSNDVIEQIKEIERSYSDYKQTYERRSLIDKLILNKELKKRYENYNLCRECKQPNTGGDRNDGYWCQSCNGKRFQQNFPNWTSGNQNVDELIQRAQLKAKHFREVIEWIEYDKFENIEYLAEGGFGTTYKATWKDGRIQYWDSENNQWSRETDELCRRVALKCLHNSKDIMVDFLREIESHVIVNGSTGIVRCHGITKDPKNNNFIMVTRYATHGSLRQYLNNDFNALTWNNKLLKLYCIASGLFHIHNKGIIHHDFHCGNILSPDNRITRITDLGLCKPANEKTENKNVYGVLPYVAPEVLISKEYTQASDIYGFGIIAYEVCTGYPPYHDIEHDETLAIRICQGLRPKSNYKIPQLILDIIKRCWDTDPLKRPKAGDLKNLFEDLWINSYNENYKDTEINKQIEETDEINKNLPSFTGTFSYSTHPQAIYTSRLLDYKNLPEPEPKNNDSDDLV